MKEALRARLGMVGPHKVHLAFISFLVNLYKRHVARDDALLGGLPLDVERLAGGDAFHQHPHRVHARRSPHGEEL